MITSKSFHLAVRDYVFLLENNYPQKSILKLVGDRYSLSGTERTVLYRGIHIQNNNIKRISKRISCREVKGLDLHIDTFNVLLTVVSYLRGNFVFTSTDGYLRDASEFHGKNIKKDLLTRAIQIFAEFLDTLFAKTNHFIIDTPHSQSQYISKKINAIVSKLDIHFDIIEAESADKHLKKAAYGILCTSDSILIDNADIPILDVAKQCLEHHFHPDFEDLKNYLNN